MSSLEAFFSGDYMPHGHCYLWQPAILWVNVLSDALIALAYFSIPFVLITLVKKRSDLQFKNLVVLFSLFILFCGITHLFSIYTIWHGSYGIHGISKAATAIVSLATAVALYRKLPYFLRLPSFAQLETAQLAAAEERFHRMEIEIQRKSDSMFRFATELLPVGLLVVDAEGKIRLTNYLLDQIFGYEGDELLAKPLQIIIDDELAMHHQVLRQDLHKNSGQWQEMCEKRVVSGIKKNGELISVAIKVSMQECEGELFTFAVVSEPELEHEKSERLVQEITRMRRAVDASNDGLWEWDVQSGRVWYSPSLMRMLGRSEGEEAQLRDWENHIHEKDRDRLKICLEAHFKSNIPFDVTYQGMNADGHYEWVRTRGNTIFDEDNRPLLMSGTLTNIENLKQLETELAKNSNFLNQVLEKSLNGLYIFDFKSTINSYINPEYTRLTGYNYDDLAQMRADKSFLKCFHPQDRDRVIQHFQTVVNDTRARGHNLEYRFRHKDGHWIWCYSRDSIYSYEDGEPKEILGSFFDITELKNREMEIQSLAQDFSSTFEQAAVGIAHVDLDGNFIKVNHKLCEILDYQVEALLQRNFADITHKDDLAKSREAIAQLLDASINYCAIEKRYIKNGGQIIWGYVTISVVRKDNGQLKHLIAVVEDITARKKIEFSLEESNAALERFAYSASHDLQEPLRKISSFVGLLKNRLSGTLMGSEAAFELDRIDKAAKRMSEMINSLLQLSRYSRQHIVKRKSSLRKLTNEVLDDISHVINRNDAAVEVEQDAVISVEPSGFKQVLQNLISNAINYGHIDRDPEITITAVEDGHKTVISVEDNGPGFKADVAEEIFEPFRRLVGKDQPGTGMGLAICRQIVKAHDGEIFAEQGGRGARFIIVLPQ